MKKLYCHNKKVNKFKMIFVNNNQILKPEYSKMQLFALTFLRVLIGWHFLYEGLVKLYSPGGWTSEFFLTNSIGPFSSIFKLLAANETILYLVDQANIWCLILIGVSLGKNIGKNT